MAIRLKAEATGLGVLLKAIETQADAESLCQFFHEKGVAANASPLAVGDNRLFLPGLAFDEFVKLIEGSNVELIH